MYSRIDRISSAFTNRLKFFRKGIGDKVYLDKLEDEFRAFSYLPNIDIEWIGSRRVFSGKILTGKFLSPYEKFLPEECKYAYIKMLVPNLLPKDEYSLCIHFAATGDQGFYKRLLGMAVPLFRKKIVSVILEIPYYGLRKPKGQWNVFVNYLSDFFKMAAGTVLEGLCLIKHFESQGYKNIAVTGISMGGIISGYVGAFCDSRVPVISCLGPHSPEPVFFKGFLAGSIHWKALAKDLGSIDAAKEYVRSRMSLCELTSLNIPKAVDSSIVIGGLIDGYVLPESVQTLHDYWKGSELRWVKAGHVSGIFSKAKEFRKAIIEALARENVRIKS
jgi:hypothetical protein